MTKVIPLSEAVRQLVRDGDLVYAAGFTHLIPFAAGHEIIRQGKRDLILARATPDLIYDQMVAGGCVEGYFYGLRIFAMDRLPTIYGYFVLGRWRSSLGRCSC